LSLEKDEANVTLGPVTSKEDLPPHILAPKVHWERASGYFALEMFEESERELRAMPKEEPWDKNARMLLLGIRQEQENWALVQEVARGLRLEFPAEADWWVSDAFATRRCETIESAKEILLEGLVLHEDSSIIRYNLACYACVLGNPRECMDFLKEAVKGEEKYKLMAVEDEDLKGVREDLIELGWGKVVV
jgi:hypothetical protein